MERGENFHEHGIGAMTEGFDPRAAGGEGSFGSFREILREGVPAEQPGARFEPAPKEASGFPDGRNRIGGCCGCGCLAVAAFLVSLILFYWLLLPPLNWITGGFFCSEDRSEEADDSRWLQREAASGFLPGLEDDAGDGEYPPPMPLPPPPEPVMPVFNR